MAGDGCGKVQGAQRASSRWWMVRQYLPVQRPELTGTLPTELTTSRASQWAHLGSNGSIRDGEEAAGGTVEVGDMGVPE